jgi:hypothetical protein
VSRVYRPGDFDRASTWTDPRPPPEVPERAELLWYMVDLDGCIAEAVYDSSDPSTAMKIGPPILKNIAKLHEVVYAGYKVVIHTSKPWAAHEAIAAWLEHYGVPYKTIQCGKPLGHRYVDDRAINSNEESWLV